MIPAPRPANEEQRLKRLHELDIMDTLEEQTYDDITHLTAQICGTPIALISLIDRDRQFLKSHHGLDANEMSRELGFCPHAILDNDLTVVEDATKDERFHDNPFVTGGPQIKFYAGAPLIMAGDLRVGTLCVVSSEAMSLTADQEKTLEVLARQVVSQLELRDTVKKLKAANMAKSEFLSSMSHELRTPMNAILGFGQMLEFNPKEPLSLAQKDCVSRILKGGNYLLELINDILELAQIEAGKIKFSIEDIQVEAAVGDCLMLVKDAAAIRNIDIAVTDAIKVFDPVRADYTRLKQVLLNLMSNAIKYNRNGGSMTIDCKITPAGRGVISVTDTGNGIAKNRQAELFIPFSRLEAENSEIEGTGIGLVVCRDLIEQMGGEIGFESVGGKGSTFWVELPLAAGHTGEADVAVAVDAVPSEGKLTDINGTMLYVEDNAANLELMEMIVLRIDGMTMLSAHSAELGIEIAKCKQPDVIVLDINLPGMNGIEAMRRLQEMDETKDIPVLALSAAATKSDLEKGRKAGFLKYLTKPLEVEEVTEAIKSAIETGKKSFARKSIKSALCQQEAELHSRNGVL